MTTVTPFPEIPAKPKPHNNKASKKSKKKKKKTGPGKGSGQNNHLDPEELKALKKRVALAALEEDLFPEIKAPNRRRFLIALCETGNRTQAALVAEVGRSALYERLWIKDTAFQERLLQVDQVAADLMESEAYRRAVVGVDEPVGWYKGEAGGMIRRYSDILLIFLLKGVRPEKYKDKLELSGGLASFDLSRLPDELLARVSGGESLMSVLASVDATKLLGSGQFVIGETGGNAGENEGAPQAGDHG